MPPSRRETALVAQGGFEARLLACLRAHHGDRVAALGEAGGPARLTVHGIDPASLAARRRT